LQAAQDKIERESAESVIKTLGTLFINDNTQPYRAPDFEQALTYFFRSVDYLSLKQPQEAAVEARKAVFYLDNLRNHKKDGYRDDPFVQYFASMLFEDEGNLSSARIARANANNAYEEYKGWYHAAPPAFALPPDINEKGEAVILHFNGKAPFIISNQVMLAWNSVWFAVEGNSDLQGVDRDIINAVYAGAFGNSITVSFPALQPNPYKVAYSKISAPGQQDAQTQLVADIASTAAQTLKEELAADTIRMITRAVTKYILSAQARNAAQNATGDKNIGALVGMLFSAASNVTEVADTRSWATLPAEIRMASLFLPPGRHDIKITFYNAQNQAIDEYVFEKVQINKGARTYLYRRTAR
ncbi:MAG: hypothetical protein LBR90_00085, partial [Elusimicrobiota bacterium]|nr:hypothetical protein [Elusimicrobiota bacterium]